MWTLRADGPVAFLHWQPNEAGGEEMWTGWVRIFKGAPAWDYHPEIHHALLSLLTPGVHASHVTDWTWDIPPTWESVSNVGARREKMILRGGRLNWTLVLQFSPRTPLHVMKKLAAAFKAKEKPDEARRPASRPSVRVSRKGSNPCTSGRHAAGRQGRRQQHQGREVGGDNALS
jgi:hypothetical protein